MNGERRWRMHFKNVHNRVITGRESLCEEECKRIRRIKDFFSGGATAQEKERGKMCASCNANTSLSVNTCNMGSKNDFILCLFSSHPHFPQRCLKKLFSRQRNVQAESCYVQVAMGYEVRNNPILLFSSFHSFIRSILNCTVKHLSQ